MFPVQRAQVRKNNRDAEASDQQAAATMPSFRVHRPPAKTAIQGWGKMTGTDRVSTSQKRSLQEDSLNGMQLRFVRVRRPASKSDIRTTANPVYSTSADTTIAEPSLR
jgi:hypothetical protein